MPVPAIFATINKQGSATSKAPGSANPGYTIHGTACKQQTPLDHVISEVFGGGDLLRRRFCRLANLIYGPSPGFRIRRGG